MKIGVLAAQGAFVEHIASLKQLDIEAKSIRLPDEMQGVDGLIIPGGESTSISRLISTYDLVKEIVAMAGDGLPVFGTCAGMILMAKQVTGNGMPSLGLMNIVVKRNAFGRQVDSFEADITIPVLGSEPFPAVFIRAPLIEKCGDGVEALAKLNDGTVVAAKQDNLLVTAFHPELTGDMRFHRYFLDMAAGKV